MKTIKYMVLIWVLWLTLASSRTHAEIKLPAIIGDNMVLQQGTPIPIWGTADPGERVTVSLTVQPDVSPFWAEAVRRYKELGGEPLPSNSVRRSAETTADTNGRWLVKLDTLPASGAATVTVAGTNTITVKNVLIGEVWVCSGQSNMEWSVRRANNPEQEIDAAKFPKIRLFKAKKVVSGKPLTDTEGAWVECTPETIPDFTAVGYFFGRDIHHKTGRPVGLIQSAWGGTPAEAWTSAGMLKSDPDFQPILDQWTEIIAKPDELQKQYKIQLASWQEAVKIAKASGKPAPRRPRPPRGPNHPHRASGLFNGMISPLLPYAIRGAIWYQGESNASRAYQYRKLFPAMIRDWRKHWKQGDFPFLFVQLANFRKVVDEPHESSWAELREAQSMTLSLPKTGMAVIIDIGEANDIHPKNKQDVGHRLALAAEKIAFGSDVVYSGPMMRSMTIEQNRIRIHFGHVGSGLVAKEGKLKGFAVADTDRKFYFAGAQIEGDTVVVRSDKVPNPIAVRYAWADNPVCNLFNQDGLPASPFRSDDWPGLTVDAR